MTLALAGATVAQAQDKAFLVGTRHVYRMEYPDPFTSDRRAIEQNYADAVAAAQSDFEKNPDGLEQAKAEEVLNQRLDDAARKRDQDLGSLYEVDDAAKDRHPEFIVDEDGPYQVMGVHFQGAVFQTVVYYEPWPGYLGEPPYGWRWREAHADVEWRSTYGVHHERWVREGRRPFGKLIGRRGPVELKLVKGEGGTFHVKGPVGPDAGHGPRPPRPPHGPQPPRGPQPPHSPLPPRGPHLPTDTRTHTPSPVIHQPPVHHEVKKPTDLPKTSDGGKKKKGT